MVFGFCCDGVYAPWSAFRSILTGERQLIGLKKISFFRHALTTIFVPAGSKIFVTRIVLIEAVVRTEIFVFS